MMLTLLRMPVGTDVAPRGPERLWTSATVVTAIRTVAAVVLAVLAAREDSLTLLVVSLVVYWAGDILDGSIARWFDCETRIGAALDILCDRLSAAAFYVGLSFMEPHLAPAALLYLANFVVTDCFISLSFLQWPIRSPNYFYVVDERIWRWNWSHLAKAVNSAAFAVLLLLTGSVWLGLIAAGLLVVLKSVSLGWLLKLGLPIPDATRAGPDA